MTGTVGGVADSSALIGRVLPEVLRSWTAEDTMLYALGVGAGSGDPVTELNLTTENSESVVLQAIPTMGIVLAGGGGAIDALGVNGKDVLLLSDRVELVHPIPVAGSVRSATRIENVSGHRLGEVIELVSEARLDGSADLLYRTVSRTLVRRGESGTSRRSAARLALPVGKGEVCRRAEFRIPANQALLYRLTAGRNPLHSDPVVSRRAGFDVPILHGRCTLGFAARILIRELCDGDASALRSFGARMTAPVWPGDRLVCDAWGSRSSGQFQVRRMSDGAAVLDRGDYECQQ